MLRRRPSSSRGLIGALTASTVLFLASCQQPVPTGPTAVAYVYSIGLLVDPGTPTSLQTVQYVDSSGTLQTLNNVPMGPIDDPVWATHFAHGWQLRIEAPGPGTSLSFQATSSAIAPVIASLNVSTVTPNTGYYTFDLSPGIAADVLDFKDYSITNGTSYVGSFFGDNAGTNSINVSTVASPPAAGTYSVYPLPTVVAGIYRIENGIATAVATSLNDTANLGAADQFSLSFTTISH